MLLHLHWTVIVQESSKVKHCMVWPHSFTSGRVKEVFVKTAQTKAHRSPRHQGSAAHWLLPVEWDALHSHQSHFFNSNKHLAAERVNTTPSALAWTGSNMSGNKHFPINNNILNNTRVFPLSYFTHKVSWTFQNYWKHVLSKVVNSKISEWVILQDWTDIFFQNIDLNKTFI